MRKTRIQMNGKLMKVVWAAVSMCSVAAAPGQVSGGGGEPSASGGLTSASGQATSSSTRATTGSAGRATSRPRLVTPAGFVRMEISGRQFMIEPGDEAWVREAVAKVRPATRPSTMPSDVVERLKEGREEFARMVAGDLGVEAEVVGKWVDEKLVPALVELQEVPTAVVTMVSYHDRVRDLMKQGWEVPAFQYNRATNEVYRVPVAAVSSDFDSVDALVPAAFEPKDAVEKRIEKLANELAVVDSDLLEAKGRRGEYLVQVGLIGLVGNDVLSKLELKPDQEWLLAGATGVLTAKYMSHLTGIPRRMIVKAMSSENPRGLRTSSLDLLHPIDKQNLRREALLPYMDAFRRKSVRAVDDLLLRHGDEVLPKILAAIREKKPATGIDLVKLVQEISGTDPTPMLQAG